MECNNNNMFFHLFLFLSLVTSAAAAAASSNITAVMAFGDSTLDPGNNNAIAATLLRADHPPYGCNFPGQVATGRFTDGKLVTDFVVSRLGLKDSLPAYHDLGLTDEELTTGVSFASAGTGLDELTAANGNVLGIGHQLDDFKEYKRRLNLILGEEKANRTVENALIVIGIGSNDMMINYYPLPVRKATFSLVGYQSFLLNKLRSTIQQIYNMGGRKFTVTGLPPIGCLPISMTVASITPGPTMFRRECIEQQNEDSMAYNSKLQKMIESMRSTLTGAKIAYVDVYNPLLDMIQNPAKYGFETTTRGCCGSGVLELGPMCSAMLPTCADPSKYLFWDSVHPSQAAYKAFADKLIESVLPQIS